MTPTTVSALYVGALIANRKGYSEAHGPNVNIRVSQGTPNATQAVLRGPAHITRARDINSIIAIANGKADLVSIGTARQRSTFDIVSTPDADIHGPDDLGNKTVGIVSGGGGTENLLDIMLANADVNHNTASRPITGLGTAAYQLTLQGETDA